MFIKNKSTTYDNILESLFELCQEDKTGVFLILTDQNRALRFCLKEGIIVGIVYGVEYLSTPSLSKLKSIKSGRCVFSTNINCSPSKITLPNNLQIFELLGFTAQCIDLQKTILVVEDSTTQRKIICNMLRRHKYQIVEAKNGTDALAKLSEGLPDLILLDIIMPDMDGYQVMAEIKKKANGLQNIPVILLTSRDSLLDKFKGKRSYACDYITKPFDEIKLLAMIEKHLPTQ